VQSSLYDIAARKRTVSLTINSDLLEKTCAAGLNISKVAEEAMAAALGAIHRERLREEIDRDSRLLAEYVATHGDPAAALCNIYRNDDAA
jgi:post-segregation antitoxin (ccd killing protein)